eukprot:scaffold207_cov345-Pavlova_lutheri.AAC.28
MNEGKQDHGKGNVSNAHGSGECRWNVTVATSTKRASRNLIPTRSADASMSHDHGLQQRARPPRSV